MKRSRFKGVTGGAEGGYSGSPERNRRFRERLLKSRQSTNVDDQRPEVTGIASLHSAGYPEGRTFLGGRVRPNLNVPVPRAGMPDWDRQREDADEVSSHAARTGVDKKTAEQFQPLRRAVQDMVRRAQVRARQRIADEKR